LRGRDYFLIADLIWRRRGRAVWGGHCAEPTLFTRQREKGGRPKGRQSQQTLDKRAAEAEYRAFLQAHHHQRLWTAALEAACGIFVLFQRTRTALGPGGNGAAAGAATGKGRGERWFLECRKPEPS
jgi:hypothetical protein